MRITDKRAARLERLRQRTQCDPNQEPAAAEDTRTIPTLPVVDRSRCEGKRDCVEICPFDVFEVRRMDNADFDALGFLARLKSRAHGRQTAYVVRGEACQACGLCVIACPEDAIHLAREPVTRSPSRE